MKKIVFILFFAIFITACDSQKKVVETNSTVEKAVNETKALEKIPIDDKVKIGKLPNGLTYYIQNNGKPANKVELRLAINAGSILEDDDQLGVAHFMEHMNFNGTKNFKKNELVDYLQSIGVKFGADLNAYTSFDQTVYILPIPSDDDEKLEKGFDILEDWAGGALLEEKDIDEERGVVLEEYRSRRGADSRMMEQY
ncbi:MAG: M16 family metallopeptidase [Flavobacteriales bacterium]